MGGCFGKVITAMVTPFDQELKVDLERAVGLARHLIANGSDALVVGGTTGESPTLTMEEKVTLFQTVKEAVDQQAMVIAGTGSYSTEESVRLSREAEAVGVDGIMLVVPYYNKPTQEGLYHHFKSIAASTRLPVMLYNVPSRTGRNMEPETVAKLARIDNVKAIKEAAGDMDQVSHLQRVISPEFDIYSGDDSLTLPMLALGATGVVSVASHLVGARIQEMISAFQSGNHRKALEIHLGLMPLFKALFTVSNPIPVKAALNLSGIQVGGVRLPLVNAGPGEISLLREALSLVGISVTTA